MKRESVKIWAGWLESIDNIPSRESRAELALAIFEYALDEREYTGADPWVKVLLPTIKKSIDNASRNAINGQKGGLQKAANSTATSTATSETSNPANSGANSTKTKDIDIDKRLKTKDNIQETKDKDKSNKKVSSDEDTKKAQRFVKPTIEEIAAYCQEKGYNIDAEYFYNYYESNGWKVGRNTMKDWKATIRNWSKKEKELNKNSNYGIYRRGREDKRHEGAVSDFAHLTKEDLQF